MTTEPKKTLALEPGTNRILRRVEGQPDEHLATYDAPSETVMYLTEDYQRRFRTSVAKLMKAADLPIAKSDAPAEEVPPTESAAPVADAQDEPPQAAIPNTQPPEGKMFTQSSPTVTRDLPRDPLAALTVAQRKAVVFLRGTKGLPLYDVEPAPGNPPRMGAHGPKSPEYVEWLLRYDPVKFVTTYRVLGIGPVAKVEEVKDDHANVMTRETLVRAVVSLAKTHLTELATDQTHEVEQ